MGFRRLSDISTWRRIALASWRAPNDPTITGFLEADMTHSLAYIERLRELSGRRITVTHLVTKAVAMAIREYPALNGIVKLDGHIWQRDTIDIFILAAVDADAEQLHRVNLSGVKIDRADDKDLVAIADEISDKVALVRAHADEEIERTTSLLERLPQPLMPAALKLIDLLTYELDLDLSSMGVIKDQFGSAIITNVGVFGLRSGFAPFLPATRCSLMVLVGEVTDKPVAVNGEVVIRPMLELGCSADHRFIDGFQASRMTRTLEGVLEDPERFLGAPEQLMSGKGPRDGSRNRRPRPRSGPAAGAGKVPGGAAAPTNGAAPAVNGRLSSRRVTPAD